MLIPSTGYVQNLNILNFSTPLSIHFQLNLNTNTERVNSLIDRSVSESCKGNRNNFLKFNVKNKQWCLHNFDNCFQYQARLFVVFSSYLVFFLLTFFVRFFKSVCCFSIERQCLETRGTTIKTRRNKSDARLTRLKAYLNSIMHI